MKKRFVVFIFIIFCFLSCDSKAKHLTGNSCKYWNIKYIKRSTGEFEKKENLSFKICKDKSITWFYLSRDGRTRTEINFDYGNDNFSINDKLWEIKNDSLLTEIENFKIIYLSKDSLLLKRRGDILYFKNEPKKKDSKIFEGESIR